MRICIDGTPLLLRSAGVKNYVYHWWKALQEELHPSAVSAYPFIDTPGALHHDRSMLGSAGTYSRIAVLHGVNRILPSAIDWAIGDVDIFHTSNQVWALPKKAKISATLHDLTVLLMPEHHTEGNRQAEQRFFDRIVRRADGLIAVSEATRNDAIRLLGLDERKVQAIHSGIDQRFFGPFDIEAVRRQYQLNKPYILYVGTIEPRKNLHTLLDAWLAMPAEVRQEHDLIFAGPAGWGSDRLMARIQSGIAGLRLLGYVPEELLPSLTAGACVFAYPSLYEGFGFPVAQAMAAGVPVVTSNVSALPEVAGPAGVLIDPQSALALRDAIYDLLLSPNRREILGRAGRERARAYTWTETAKKSVQFFEGLLG